MSQKTIKTNNAPGAIGPYSQAVALGNLVFCSGQIPLTPSGELITGPVEDQTRQVFENLKAVLEASGSSLSQVLQTTCYLSDMGEFTAFNSVYGEYFAEPYPARATVQVAGLPKGAKVEVSCTATTR